MTVTSTPITIGLFGHSVNSDNLGIGALTASHIAILDEVARDLHLAVRYKVICWRDRAPAYISRSDIDVAALRIRHLLKPNGLYAVARTCDLILDIGTGDSFTDIYGARRFLLNTISKMTVLMTGRPLILSPQTIGPFERWWTRRIAALLMRAARAAVTRDNLSSEFVRSMGLGGRLVEATDVAFQLPYDPPVRRASLPVRVGINVSGLLFNGGYTRNNMFSLAADYATLARALVGHFSALPDCEVHLVGHVNSDTHTVEDDYRVAHKLAAEHPGAILAPRFQNPSAAKSYIATMDFFCGSRMHACIAAFSAGVPVMPIAYSRKFVGLFGALGYEHVADCRTQDTREILAMIVDAFERRTELQCEVDAARATVEGKLAAYEVVLRDVLTSIGSSRCC